MALDAFTGSVGFSCTLNPSKTYTGLPATTVSIPASKNISMTLGIAAAQCNQLYSATRTIAGGGAVTDNLDFSGVLTDPVGNTSIIMARAKFLLVWLLSATDTAPDGSTVGTAASSIVIGDHATPCAFGFLGTNPRWRIKNGDFFVATCADASGWTVGAGATDFLKILNEDATFSAVYFIAVGGCAT